jgi:hypothetical protein
LIFSSTAIAQAAGDLLTEITQGAFRLVCDTIRAIAQFDFLLALAIFLRMLFSLTDHTIDLCLREATGSCNSYLLLTPGCLVVR